MPISEIARHPAALKKLKHFFWVDSEGSRNKRQLPILVRVLHSPPNAFLPLTKRKRIHPQAQRK